MSQRKRERAIVERVTQNYLHLTMIARRLNFARRRRRVGKSAEFRSTSSQMYYSKCGIFFAFFSLSLSLHIRGNAIFKQQKRRMLDIFCGHNLLFFLLRPQPTRHLGFVETVEWNLLMPLSRSHSTSRFSFRFFGQRMIPKHLYLV